MRTMRNVPQSTRITQKYPPFPVCEAMKISTMRHWKRGINAVHAITERMPDMSVSNDAQKQLSVALNGAAISVDGFSLVYQEATIYPAAAVSSSDTRGYVSVCHFLTLSVNSII